jgi:hypothetical protein
MYNVSANGHFPGDFQDWTNSPAQNQIQTRKPGIPYFNPIYNGWLWQFI